MNNLQEYKGTQQLSPFATTEGFETAMRISKALMSSDIVPAHFRNNMGNCLIAMEIAARTGSSILAVMQSLYVVHGTPSWSGQYCIAALNQSGRFKEPVHFQFQGEPGKDDYGCRAVGITKSGTALKGPLITIGLAKAEGWYNRKGSKWQTIPELMLRYRAAAWLAKTAAPEVLMGMQTTEELQDAGEKVITGAFERVDANKPIAPEDTEETLDEINAKLSAELDAQAETEEKKGEQA